MLLYSAPELYIALLSLCDSNGDGGLNVLECRADILGTNCNYSKSVTSFLQCTLNIHPSGVVAVLFGSYIAGAT